MFRPLWAAKVRYDEFLEGGTARQGLDKLMSPLAKTLIYAGLALLAAGVVVHLAARMGLRLGRLPGDIEIRGRHSNFYFPLATCLLLSVVISLLSYFLRKR
jgi:hypothetical protein